MARKVDPISDRPVYKQIADDLRGVVLVTQPVLRHDDLDAPAEHAPREVDFLGGQARREPRAAGDARLDDPQLDGVLGGRVLPRVERFTGAPSQEDEREERGAA